VAAAQTITVGPSATYKTIQSAVTAASTGDIILVQSGTYVENVIVDKAVILKAAPGATPVVDAGSKGPAFRVRAAATIDGFTVRNSGSANSAILVTVSGATIANNKVSGCGWGIFLETGTGSTVKGNAVDGAVNAGIGARNSNKNTVTGNKVTNSGKGINIEGTSAGNTIYFNDFNNGASVSGVTNTFNSPSALAYTYKGKAYAAHIVGNFWGDYRSTDANGNGLGDAVYNANGITDSYPLIASIANFALGGSATPTPNPTVTPAPTGTPRPTVTPSPTATPAPTVTPAPTATPTPGNGPVYIDPAVPSGARQVATQADINALPAGSSAVLTANVGALTLSKQISLFGNGRTAGAVTLAADGIRISGLTATSVVVKANNCIVDHNKVNSNVAYAIQASKVSGLKVLSNTIVGSRTTNSAGIYVANSTSVVIDGNKASGAYYSFYTYGVSRAQISYNYVSHYSGYRQGIDFHIRSTFNSVFNNNEVEFNPYTGPGQTADHDAIGFYNCDGLTISNNKAGGHYYTLKVYYSTNCVVENNNLYTGGIVLRTGFWSSNLMVRNNVISGEPKVGRSVGLYIHDGTKNCTYQGNTISYCQYGVQQFHYPTGTKYLEGRQAEACSKIYILNNKFSYCTGAALAIQDDSGCTVTGNTVTNCAQNRIHISV
jgi:parallel beta-helix repeat protein